MTPEAQKKIMRMLNSSVLRQQELEGKELEDEMRVENILRA